MHPASREKLPRPQYQATNIQRMTRANLCRTNPTWMMLFTGAANQKITSVTGSVNQYHSFGDLA